jgi:hypothetical protein
VASRKARPAGHRPCACSGVNVLRNTATLRRQTAKLRERFGPLTPSARSGNRIAGDGTKNSLSRSKQGTIKINRQQPRGKSPLTGKAHTSLPLRSGGSQFTSDRFIGTLGAHDVTISMDGKGRCMDNLLVERRWRSLKYEEVYLHAYAAVAEAKAGMGAWISFDNDEHQHQSLGYRTATSLRASPVDMWTIGFADRLRFPRQLGKRRNARLRPHTHSQQRH